MFWKEWAFKEIERTGLCDKNSEFGGKVGKILKRMVIAFDRLDANLFIMRRVAYLFYRLMNWKPLLPVTNDPNEWEKLIKVGNEFIYSNKYYLSLYATESQLKNNLAEDDEYYCKIDDQGRIYYDEECKKIVNLPYIPPAESKPLKGDKENE